MIRVYNDMIVVPRTDPSYIPLKIGLERNNPERIVYSKRGKITLPATTDRAYMNDRYNIFIPSGLFEYVKPMLHEYKDLRTQSHLHNTNEIIEHIEEYKDILDGITLRAEQIIACKKILANHRCIVQMCTGAGKSEVMCAVSKMLAMANNNTIPTILILEPTIRLVNDMVARFEKYGIPVVKYSNNRCIIENCVNICHPKSLGNDLDKDESLLESVEVMFCDETHHLKSESWRKPTYRMSNLAYAVGVSASAISQSHVNVKDIQGFDYNELLTIESTGPIVMNVTADMMIGIGNLATPVLLMVNNPANEPIREQDIANWHKVVEIKLKSDRRIELVAESAKKFEDRNMKSLILVSTIEWSRLILKKLHDIGSTAVASYGGGKFEIYNGAEFINLGEDTMDKFSRGEFMILIGTSHLYEGVDIPNLDAIILAYGGKGERMQIQGLGRVLRKTKSGNMAYIVDFTDLQDVVLRKHSRMRMERYRDIIGIPNERIYYNVEIDEFDMIIDKYEK